jgi:hypothetical protein
VKFGTSFGTGAFVGHRATRIKKYVASKIGFLLVFADVETVALAVYFPVKVPDLVSRDVLPVLLEFYAEPLVRGPVQAVAKSFDHSSCQNLMVGEPSEILRV